MAHHHVSEHIVQLTTMSPSVIISVLRVLKNKACSGPSHLFTQPNGINQQHLAVIWQKFTSVCQLALCLHSQCNIVQRRQVVLVGRLDGLAMRQHTALHWVGAISQLFSSISACLGSACILSMRPHKTTLSGICL